MDKRVSHDFIKEFIVTHRDTYYRLVYSYVHNREDTFDIIQDAICKALSTAKTLNHSEAAEAWFIRILINTSLDYIRKNKRYTFIDDALLDVVTPPAEDQYPDIDLKEAIEKLPTLNKTVILLRYFQDMKIDEIAHVMNENVNTTKSRLYSSLKKLKISLEDET